MKKIEKIKQVYSKSKLTNLIFLDKFCEGDKDLMLKYIKIFIDTAPLFIGKLKVEIEQRDYQAIAIQIHGFKIKLIMMGMKETKEFAFRIERDCKEKLNLENVRINIFKLVDDIEEAIIELKTFPLE